MRMREEINMASKGYIVTQVFTANQVIPVENASVLLTKKNGGEDDLLGFFLTDSSGRTKPVEVETPDESLSREPGHKAPFAVVDIRIEHPSYYPVIIEDAQVFGGTTTLQLTEMIPVADNLNPAREGAENVLVTPQNL